MNTLQWKDTLLTFSKTGRMAFISHLDVVRVMSQAFRRAAVPLWYTEGFHPQPYLSFPLPLSLGQEGLGEWLAVRLVGDTMQAKDVPKYVNPFLPDGLRLLIGMEAIPPPITQAAYTIRLAFPTAEAAAAWQSAAEQILRTGCLTAQKTGKQGHKKVQKTIELAPLVYKTSFMQNDNLAALQCTLAAGQEKSLNPALLLEALSAECGEAQVLSITRLPLADSNPISFRV
ncbi:MAG: TIGR03936 family radical SAM-associated protein [Oscillospiraceae bacterium]|jgi:radical SAM-linked protein|nr:TIGR03936 family radical SAM-associated protein [Oscillospiraceae bacterium]